MHQRKNETQHTFWLYGNTTAVYPEGSEGVAFSEVMDDAGRFWWFVYMKNNLDPIENYVTGGDNSEIPYYTFGWVFSEYVEKTEE